MWYLPKQYSIKYAVLFDINIICITENVYTNSTVYKEKIGITTFFSDIGEYLSTKSNLIDLVWVNHINNNKNYIIIRNY